MRSLIVWERVLALRATDGNVQTTVAQGLSQGQSQGQAYATLVGGGIMREGARQVVA
jgi:hypothetical protein